MATRHGTASQVTGSYVEFQAAVLRALPRSIDPDIALGWMRNGESLARVLRNALLPNGKQMADDTYSLFVDYGESVEDAVKLGLYDCASGDVNSKNFTTKRIGKADITVELVHFHRYVSTSEVLRALDTARHRCRPAELHELLAFGQKYPEVQCKFPIVALGSIWRNQEGTRMVPYLGGDGSKRNLATHYWINVAWGEICRFAAVRK